MCTGVEIALMASAAVSAVGAIAQGQQQKAAMDDQAQIARNDAAYKADAAKAQAEKIRRLGKAQRGEAKAALAASGVKLGEGTPLELEKDIAQKSEEDALSALLTGKRITQSANDEAAMLQRAGNNAVTNSYFSAGSSVLSAGATYAKGGWKKAG